MRLANRVSVGIAWALLIALAGCAGVGAPAASTAVTPAVGGGSAATRAGSTEYTSAALPSAYENALPAGTQLALGILRLEGTPQAVTPAQAKTLLPLWQAFQGNALQNQTEQNAVLKQIEGTLTAEQVQAIAAMQLTNDDMRKWMEENGQGFGPPPGTPGAPGQGGGPPNMTDEQRAAFQATRQAGGGPPDFGNMTDEQRAAFRATAQASGRQFPQGAQGGQGGPGPRGTPGPGGSGGGGRFFASYRSFVGPLVEMLTARSAP
jgi:hypothetical protein